MKPRRDGARLPRAEATIDKLVAGGFGLCRVDGEVVLVARAAPSDVVAIEIDRSKRPARGRILKVLTPSAGRVEPRCPIVERCGGCDWMHLSVDAQREARESILRESLPEAARATPVVHHAATPSRGRTRARWHARTVGARATAMVGYRGAASATLVDVERCAFRDPRREAARADARALIAGAEGDGEIHAALGRDGKPVLSLVWRGALAAGAYGHAERAISAGRLAGVEVRLEGARVPATIGDPRPVALALDGAPFVTSAGGFAQASDVGDAVLVRLVVERAAASGERVVELFAGSGNLTVALAPAALHVTAIERVDTACTAARENVRGRGLAERVKIVCADADATPIPAGTGVVVLDPPRTGAAGACRAIAARRPKRVVYVSCDPPTLGRDLALLLDAGYRLESLDAVDMFPETSHLETVATLVRGER
ncbi:MAG: 23S rRNA (uracil(1939)-C(5))-methyltransferase RlmD [Polyangiales bacterium]